MARTKLVAVSETGHRMGVDNPRCKWSDGEVYAIQRLYDEGMGFKNISRTMNIPVRTVRDICAGRRRACLPAKYKRVEVDDE